VMVGSRLYFPSLSHRSSQRHRPGSRGPTGACGPRPWPPKPWCCRNTRSRSGSGWHGCPSDHTQEYYQGYEAGYIDEGWALHDA
jgi:hypothetical protein